MAQKITIKEEFVEMACPDNPVILMDIKMSGTIHTLKLELFNHLYPAFTQTFQKFATGHSEAETDDAGKTGTLKFKFRNDEGTDHSIYCI